MEEQIQEFTKQYGQVVAKAWADDEFKQQLLADPAAILQAEGIPVPAGVEVRAVENTDKVVYLTLPPKPSEDLSDEQLDQISGGMSTAGSMGSASTAGSICASVSSFATIFTAGSAG